MVLLTWIATQEGALPLGGDAVDVAFEQLTLDGSVSERYTDEAVATEHPVEQGAPVTDHVRPALRQVDLEVAVSAHPGPTSAANADLTEIDAPALRPATVRQTLQRLREEAVEIDVETPVGVWESMLLVAVEEERLPESGDGLRARLSFRELRRVATLEVDAPSPRVERGRRASDRGRQPTPTASTEAVPDPRSDAQQVRDALGDAGRWVQRQLGGGGGS